VARHVGAGQLSDDTVSAESEDQKPTATADNEGTDAQTSDDIDIPSPDEHAVDEAEARYWSPVRLAAAAGLVGVLALAGLVGWLSFRAYEARETAKEQQLFLQVGRQGAVNLTTIDYNRVDDDVARILDSSTGTFHADFHARAQPFADVVRKAQTTTVGTVTEAGLESVDGDGAQVFVAVQVKTSIGGALDPQAKGWRMRIDVQKVGDEAKVSNVEFIP
jgi:Mce-associated membrane protein